MPNTPDQRCLRVRNHLGRDIYGSDPRVLEIAKVEGSRNISRIFSIFFRFRDEYLNGENEDLIRKEERGEHCCYRFSLRELGEAFLGTYSPEYFADFLGTYIEEGEQEEALVHHIRKFRELFKQVIISKNRAYPLFNKDEFETFAPKRKDQEEKPLKFKKFALRFMEGQKIGHFLSEIILEGTSIHLNKYNYYSRDVRGYSKRIKKKALERGIANLAICLNAPPFLGRRTTEGYTLLGESAKIREAILKKRELIREVEQNPTLLERLIEKTKIGELSRGELKQILGQLDPETLTQYFIGE